MIVISGGDGNCGNIGGAVGGGGMGAESSDPARKETCSGNESEVTALPMPFGDWMVHFAVIGWCTFAPMSVPS
jgi:hypothetical protein